MGIKFLSNQVLRPAGWLGVPHHGGPKPGELRGVLCVDGDVGDARGHPSRIGPGG